MNCGDYKQQDVC